jgi:hypothetical protein
MTIPCLQARVNSHILRSHLQHYPRADHLTAVLPAGQSVGRGSKGKNAASVGFPANPISASHQFTQPYQTLRHSSRATLYEWEIRLYRPRPRSTPPRARLRSRDGSLPMSDIFAEDRRSWTYDPCWCCQGHVKKRRLAWLESRGARRALHRLRPNIPVPNFEI